MTRVTRIESRVAPLPINDIDTDQIIPARYLKITDKSGLAEGLFSNWRDTPDFSLNQPQYKGARVLLAGDNFGCGSSREHAPWALLEGGYQAVISTSFADIFRNNSLKNGLLVVEVDKPVWAGLLADVERDPSLQVVIDLEEQALTLPDGSQVRFTVDPFARHCLLGGIDQFGYLLEQLPEIEAWENERAPRVDTR
jgi:3-isopropylmalate/(R)-2-methylmalate dehydratase small subunit